MLYAFDVPHKPATDGAISEAWRSPDSGETWTMLCAFALAVRSFASTAAGDIVLGGCVDDRGALARWRDPEVAAFVTARALEVRAPKIRALEVRTAQVRAKLGLGLSLRAVTCSPAG